MPMLFFCSFSGSSSFLLTPRRSEEFRSAADVCTKGSHTSHAMTREPVA